MGNDNENVYAGYPKLGALIVGILQVIGALALIGIQIAFSVDKLAGSNIGTGFWAGGFFLICGILSLASSKKNTMALVIAVMVMDILGCIVAWAAVGAGFTSAIFSVGDEALDIEGKYDVERKLSMAQSGLAGIEGILVIIGSILCCVGCCGCCSKPQQTRVIYGHTNAGGVPPNSVYVTSQG